MKLYGSWATGDVRSPVVTVGRVRASIGVFVLSICCALTGCSNGGNTAQASSNQQPTASDEAISAHAESMLELGREAFRFDTFGDEAFWGDALKLHLAIAGEEHGGVGGGLSPRNALGLGLKVDADALPSNVRNQIRQGDVDLDDPAVTLLLLQQRAVVGVTGLFDANQQLQSIGIQCALCHSTVDDSLAPGIGSRLDGWANRDLNVGA